MYHYAIIHKNKFSRTTDTYAAITTYEALTLEEAKEAFLSQFLGQEIVDHYECMTKQNCINLVNNRGNVREISYILPHIARASISTIYKNVTTE